MSQEQQLLDSDIGEKTMCDKINQNGDTNNNRKASASDLISNTCNQKSANYTTSISLDALGKIDLDSTTTTTTTTTTATPTPTSTATSPDPDDGVIKIHLKTSIFKKTIKTDRNSMTLGSLKQMSIDFINELFPNHSIDDLHAQLILRKYDPIDESFVPFNAVSDIHHNAYVVVELSEKCPTTFISGQRGCPQKNPHAFKEHTYLKPTNCCQCSTMLMGLYKQGLQCVKCRKNYHKHCAQLFGNDGCLPSSQHNQNGHNGQHNNSTYNHLTNNNNQNQYRVHRLVQSVRNVRRHDHKETIKEGWLMYRCCDTTNSAITRHYWRLGETDITLYRDQNSKRFSKSIPLIQIKRVLSSSEVPNAYRTQFSPRNRSNSHRNSGDSSHGLICNNLHNSTNNLQNLTNKEMSQLNCAGINFSHTFALETCTGAFYLIEADSSDDAREWRARIVQTMAQFKQENVTHQQQQNTQLHVQNNTNTSHNQLLTCNNLNDKDSGISGSSSGVSSSGSDLLSLQQTVNNIDQKRRYISSPRASPFRRPQRMSRLEKLHRITIKVPSKDIPDHLVAHHYLIEKHNNEKRILGAGQFGHVYAAIGHFEKVKGDEDSYRGVPVAIKEICKTRFLAAQQEQLRNEAEILKQLDHPGVIILDNFYDLDTKIYIVMERMKNDMLELILSTEGDKLTERLTKFLIYQILEALKYLHGKNFAHCDLKPENVLLVNDCDFPQIKLCDFGFAKIIDENSFRNSLVGTPAYLAPEVVSKCPYNKALDLWSSGVIVYVSLSGTFPFNNSATIEQQIAKTDEFYPKDPWSTISLEARDFINKLLTVEPDKRPSASSAQQHVWLNDFQLWCDLIELESQLGKSFVWTDKADYVRWCKYAADHGKTIPRYAIDTYGEGRLEC